MSKLKKALAAFGVLLLVTVGVNFATATTASAAPYCPNGYVCIYQHTGGNGNSYWASGSYGSCQNLSAAWNDVASSARNGMPFQVKLWQNSNCTGWSVGLGAECGGCLGSYVNDLGAYWFNDTTSSISFYG